MKSTLTFILLFLGYSCSAQDTTKILFVGNSFTAAYNLHELVRDFYAADGSPVYTYAYAPGGISVGDVAMGTAAHMYNPLVFDLIRNTDWDFMVLQDNQGRFSLDSAVFPKVTTSKVIEGHLKIRDSFHFYHPCGKMVWFSGWGFKDEDTAMIKRIAVNYRVMNDSAKDVIAPIGAAWKTSVILRPLMDLWDADGAHPGMPGSYLTAAVIYGTLSGKDVSVNPFNYTLPIPDADFLKTIAQQTLTDAEIRKGSNLDGILPLSLSWDKIKLKGQDGKLLYRWYRDGKMSSSTTDSVLIPTVSGTYRLWAQDKSGAWQKSCTQYVELASGIKGNDAGNAIVELFPNPAQELVYLSGLKEQMYTIEVYSVQGNKVLSRPVNGSNPLMDISMLSSGVYWLKYTGEQDVVPAKILRLIKK